MSESERRTLTGVACFLLLASLLRHGIERRTTAVELPEDSARAVELATESREIRDDEEARRRPLGPDERIDLNHASEVDINRLTGVGRATAAAIVREREERGPFVSADDLVRVRGVGPATVERLRAQVQVTPGVGGTPPLAGRGPGQGGGGAGGAGGARSGAWSTSGAPASSGGMPAHRVVDVNRATVEELTALPGIGPAIAGRIVAARAARGGFGSAEDLLDVPGIGPATLERLRPLVVVGR